MTLFGTGIAETVMVDPTFPLAMNGLEVRINGRQAPIYKTSPGEVSVVVPYDLGDPKEIVAEIQVIRNGVPSNRVTTFLNRETPGLFTLNSTGVGYAGALHPDFSLVTASHPALPGEFIAFFLSGMGPVNPTVVAGTPAPVNPLSRTTTTFSPFIQRRPAPVQFSGLAPTLGGLYQFNLQIPTQSLPGDWFLEVDGPNSINSQVQIPIGSPVIVGDQVDQGAAAVTRPVNRRPSRPTRPTEPSPRVRPGGD